MSAHPHFEATVDRVAAAVEFAQGRIWGGFPTREFLVCVAAMNEVVWAINPLRWAWRVSHDATLPGGDPEAALAAGAGLCGHAATTYGALVARFGLPVRPVQFYWTSRFGDRNHVGCEVSYDGAWHYFDPFWGAFWEQGGIVLGMESLRAGAAATLRRQETLLFALVGDSWADLDCLTDSATTVVYAAYEFDTIRRT